MSDSERTKTLNWMIDKLENGTSVTYPDGSPGRLQQYKEQRQHERDKFDWLMGFQSPSEITAVPRDHGGLVTRPNLIN